MTVQRRDLMKTMAALPLATLAGCTGVLEDGDTPEYARSTPREGADDGDGVFFVHVDAEWLRAFDGEEELPYASELPDAVDIDVDPETPPVDVDPLVAYPTAGLVLGALGIGFGVLPYGFGDVLLDGLDDEVTPEDADTEETPDAEADTDRTVRIDSMLLVDGVGVFRGEFDARTLVAAADDFEPVDERGDFDVYEGTDDGFLGTDGLAFAVRDDVLVTLLDEDSDLEAVLASMADETDGLGDTDDGGWALSEAGHGHVTLGLWGDDPEQTAEDKHDREFVDTEDVFDDADGLVSSFTLGPEEGVGTLAAAFPDGDTPQRAAIENQVGRSASTREIEIEDTRVSVTGIWRVPDEAE